MLFKPFYIYQNTNHHFLEFSTCSRLRSIKKSASFLSRAVDILPVCSCSLQLYIFHIFRFWTCLTSSILNCPRSIQMCRFFYIFFTKEQNIKNTLQNVLLCGCMLFYVFSLIKAILQWDMSHTILLGILPYHKKSFVGRRSHKIYWFMAHFNRTFLHTRTRMLLLLKITMNAPVFKHMCKYSFTCVCLSRLRRLENSWFKVILWYTVIFTLTNNGSRHLNKQRGDPDTITIENMMQWKDHGERA